MGSRGVGNALNSPHELLEAPGVQVLALSSKEKLEGPDSPPDAGLPGHIKPPTTALPVATEPLPAALPAHQPCASQGPWGTYVSSAGGDHCSDNGSEVSLEWEVSPKGAVNALSSPHAASEAPGRPVFACSSPEPLEGPDSPTGFGLLGLFNGTAIAASAPAPPPRPAMPLHTTRATAYVRMIGGGWDYQPEEKTKSKCCMKPKWLTPQLSDPTRGAPQPLWFSRVPRPSILQGAVQRG